MSSLTRLTQICHSCYFLGLLMQTASLPDVCWLHLSLSVSLFQSCLTYPHVLKLQLVCPFPLAAIPYSLLFSRFYHFLTNYVIHVFFFFSLLSAPLESKPHEDRKLCLFCSVTYFKYLAYVQHLLMFFSLKGT